MINFCAFGKSLLSLLRTEAGSNVPFVGSSACLWGREVKPGRWREESTRVSQRPGPWLGGAGVPTLQPSSRHPIFQAGLGAFLPPWRQVVSNFRRMLAGVAKPLPFSWRLGPDECSSGYFWLQTIVICNPKFSADLSACGTLGLRGCAGGVGSHIPAG